MYHYDKTLAPLMPILTELVPFMFHLYPLPETIRAEISSGTCNPGFASPQRLLCKLHITYAFMKQTLNFSSDSNLIVSGELNILMLRSMKTEVHPSFS